MEEEKNYPKENLSANPLPANPLKEKKEFLKREEIDTMGKDVARLREVEAQKEKERIATLNVDGIQKTQAPAAEKSQKEAESGLLIPKSIKKPPSYQKIIARAGLIFFLALIGGLIYWNYSNKPSQPVAEINPEEPEATTSEEQIVKELDIPLPLIPTNSSKIIEINSAEQAPASLAAFLQEKPAEGFIQILFKDASENKFLNLAEFAAGFSISYPEGFLEKLEEETTFFSYYSQENHRFGFVAKTNDQAGLATVIKSWEPKIEEDMTLLLQTLGKQGKSLVPYFRQVNYQNTSFRFLTVSKNDFGICYSLTNNYLIFATSFVSIQKVINQINLQ